MKSKNRVYVILLVAIVTTFAFFFSTKLWLPDDRIKQNLNYNELISIGDWAIHIGDAEYDSGSHTMRCKVYQKAVMDNAKAYHVTVYLGRDTLKKRLPCTLEKSPHDPDIRYLEVRNVPQKYYYLSVVITAQPTDYSVTNSSYSSSQHTGSDPYEETFSSSGSAPLTDTKTVQIDYRIAKNIRPESSSESAPSSEKAEVKNGQH